MKFEHSKYHLKIHENKQICVNLHANVVNRDACVQWCYFNLTTVMILINLALQVYDYEEAIHSE